MSSPHADRQLRRRLRLRIGRRGTALLILGGIWVLIGIAVWTTSTVVDPSRYLLHERIPVPIRALAWTGTGAVALASAFRRHPGADRWGFVALVVLPIERAGSYAFAWAWSIIGPPGQGFPAGFGFALIWAAFTGLIVLIAGWPEAEGYRPPPGRS